MSRGDGYVELHARSAFSFLRGACQPEAYADRCADLDQPGMALIDVDGVCGAPRFHQAMNKAGLAPYIGAEVACEDGARYPLLVANRVGYQNLCRLITRMKLRTKDRSLPVAARSANADRDHSLSAVDSRATSRDREGAVKYDELAEFAEGLICLSGDADGPLAQGLRSKQGRATVERLQRIFGPTNLYLELQRHGARGQEARNQAIVDLARSMRLPLVATNGPCYAEPRQREILDVFTCLRHHTTLDLAGRRLEPNAERYPKSTREMTRLFADVPDAVANTRVVAERLRFTLADLGYQFPLYPVPDGHTQSSYLRKITEEFARRRYRDEYDGARPQIEKELNVIEKLGFSGYFLIVWDIVQYCRAQGILVQGRGSAANSAVCYSLGITAVDPVKMELLFERFLSENRGEWPDIDLDLPSGDQRERAIQYVYERYGKLGAAMTANVITYRGRSAVREAGKVLGFDEPTLARVSKLVPMYGWTSGAETPENQVREAGLDVSNKRVAKLLELIVGLQDLPRHLSQHPGGMVVCQGQLDSIVPLEPATMPDRVIVQWDKEDCADLGIVKVDLLGLGMMAAIEESLELIERHHGEKVDLGRLPQDDPKVYASLQVADTIGLFQVESRAQQASLPRMKPEKFYDLVVQVAIIRPGPIQGKMVHPYIARRQGREKPDPLHPSLEPILRRTLGVPLFQEQLLRVAMVAAGFTGGEAEELRRAFGFKRSEKRMREIEVKLRAGMERNGITGAVQDRIVQGIGSFAMYGFPESHAASFALLAYASAYLRTYYRAAFTCALLNNQPMGFYHPATLVKDAQRHGVRVLPVDINASKSVCELERKTGTDFFVPAVNGSPDGVERPWTKLSVPFSRDEDLHLRLGFNYVRGLARRTGEAIEARQPFASIDDLAQRVPELGRDDLNQLASVGALNSIGASHRRDALWKASEAVRSPGALFQGGQSALSTEAGGQRMDFGPQGTEETVPFSLRQMSLEERLAADCSGMGMTIGKHPMAYRREEMDKLRVVPASGLARIANGRRVRVAGNVIVRQRPMTAKGVLFISLEDETGIANIVVMPDLFERQRLDIVSNSWIVAEGRMQNVDKVIHVLAEKIIPLANPLAIGAISHDFH